MSRSNTRDVSLVIRAKNEASAGIKSVTDGLKQLDAVQGDVAGSATDTAAKLDTLGKGLAGLEAVSKKIGAATEAANGAIQRQAQALVSTNQQINDRKARVDDLTRALGILATEADKAFIGPRRDGLSQQIGFIRKELRAAQAALSTDDGNFARLLANLQQSRSAYREIQASGREAEGAVASFSAEIANQTRLLEQNSAAGRQAAAAQSFFNNKFAPGLDRQPLTAADQAEVAAVLRVAEARDLEIRKLREEAAAVGTATRAQQQYNAVLDQRSGKSARDSASVFSDQGLSSFEQAEKAAADAAAEMERMDVAAARLREELNPLAAIETRLASEQAELNRLFRAGKISAQELADGMALLKRNSERASQIFNAAGGKGPVSLFGLRPHDITNLQFQINDIFTQLASGTSLTQTLAQQGGQILQIFPRVTSALLSALANPAYLGAAVVFGSIALALKKAADQAEGLRQLNGALSLNADGARYKATALLESSKALDQFGLSAKSALAVVRLGVKEGIDPARIVQFGEAALNLADVLGIKVEDAAKQLADAFTGGFEALEKFDKQTNVFTASQLAMIKGLFEQSRAQEAVAAATDIMSGKLDSAASNARGPWTEATRSMAGAWESFLGFLADRQIVDDMAKSIDGLAGSTDRFFRRLNAALTSAEKLADATAKVRDIENEMANYKSAGRAPLFGYTDADLRAAKTDVNRMQREIAKDGQKDSQKLRLEATEAQKKADSRVAAEIERAALAAGQVTKQSDIQTRLAIVRANALRDIQNREPDASAAVQAAFANKAVDNERVKLNKQLTDYKKQQADAAERAYAADLANSSNEALNKTASGFIGQNETSNRGSLQDFFKANGITVDPEMTAWCAAFVNAVLTSNGIKGTGSLSAKSFLGFGQEVNGQPRVGDIVILNRGDNPAEGHVGFFQGFDAKGNVKVLGGNQKDGVNVQTFNKKDVAGVRRAPSQGDVAQKAFQDAEALRKKQETFNDAIDGENSKRELTATLLKKQIGLTGEALIADLRQQAVSEALLAARIKAEKDGLALSDARIAKIEETTGALFDQQHAVDVLQARRAAVDDPVTDLSAVRDGLQERITQLQQTGQMGLANQLLPQLDLVNAKLGEAILLAQDFYASLTPEQASSLDITAAQIDAISLKLETAKLQGREFGFVLNIAKNQIAQGFTNAATSGVDQFAQSIASGANAISSMHDAFLSFASDFLRQIANMIAQQLLLNAVSGFLGLGGVGAGADGAVYGGTLGGIYHKGGIAGRGGVPTKALPSAIFAGAARFHSGGFPGLKPDEIPAILERGEEVLTRDDPRHAANGEPVVNLRNINVFDSGDMLEKALGTKIGEKAILNFVRTNARAVKSVLG